MNFDEAIKAHTAWKMRLSTYLTKPDGSLVPKEIEAAHKCELGRWIDGDASKEISKPVLETMRALHTQFHKAAASIVSQANAGKRVAEDVALGSTSEFAKVSSSVISELMKLKRAAK